MAKNEKAKTDPASEAENKGLPEELYLQETNDNDDPWDWYLKEQTREGIYVVYVPVRVVSVKVKSVRKETVI